MNKEVLSLKQGICLLACFILGSSLVAGVSFDSEQDSWISCIIGVLMTMPIIVVYSRLIKKMPGKGIFEMMYCLFGKYVGSIFTILFSFYAFHLGAMVIRNFSEFIQVMSLPETPQFAVQCVIGIICFFSVKKGVEVLGRVSVFILPIVLSIIILTTILGTNQMNISYLKPMFSLDIKTIMSSAFSTFAFPFAESVLFICILNNLSPKNKQLKAFSWGITISGIFLVIAMLRNLLLLGAGVMGSVYFSSYSATEIIDIGDFLTRMEVLISANFIVLGIVKGSVCLYITAKGVTQLFSLENYKMILAPIALLMIAFSNGLYANTMEMFDFFKVYKYYGPVFQVAIPLILLVFAEIKFRNGKIETKTGIFE